MIGTDAIESIASEGGGQVELNSVDCAFDNVVRLLEGDAVWRPACQI